MSLNIESIIQNPKNLYIIKNIYKIKNLYNPFEAIPKDVEIYFNNGISVMDYTVSLPIDIFNKYFYIFKVQNSYKFKNMPSGINYIIKDSFDKNKYTTLYLFDKNKINKKLTLMEENKIIYIPVRYTDDQTDICAIISQEKLSEYIILSDTFKNTEKKNLFSEILSSPLTDSRLVILPPVQ